MNQFDFISFCYVLLNDCKNIYDDEMNSQIFFKILKLFSLYLIYNLDQMRNFINSDKFRILIILLIKNYLLIDENSLELIFYLSYAQEKIDDEISNFGISIGKDGKVNFFVDINGQSFKDTSVDSLLKSIVSSKT